MPKGKCKYEVDGKVCALNNLGEFKCEGYEVCEYYEEQED